MRTTRRGRPEMNLPRAATSSALLSSRPWLSDASSPGRWVTARMSGGGCCPILRSYARTRTSMEARKVGGRSAPRAGKETPIHPTSSNALGRNQRTHVLRVPTESDDIRTPPQP